ncbi:MAG: hypothetical protein JJU13_16945 [Balneolaceae bacterium]|nr:hypothetical protein [Balneolaceae bacterium]
MALLRKKNTITREIYSIKVLQVLAAVAISIFMFLSCSTKSDSVYTLTTSTDPAASGIVTPSQGGFDKGSEVEITATANENMVFSGWRGDFVGSENPTVITMNSDKNIMAFFVEMQYSLSIHIEGEGTVTERILLEKSTEYGEGTFIELTAIPAEGWRLAEWQGDLSGSENPEQITIDSPKEVTAVFAQESEEPEESRYNLTLNVDGEGSVSIDPEQDEYESGTMVELTATPSDGWEFVEWTGDINSSDSSVELTMDSNKEVTAVFAEETEEPEESRYNLAVNVNGEGTVNIDPEQSEYESGTMVQLTAIPSGGWEFVEWSGDINSSQTSVEITMDSNNEVTAVFAEESDEPEESGYNLAVNVDGEGTVNIDPEQSEYESGTMVELTAIPLDGWEFVEWAGDVNSSRASVEIMMDTDKEVTAVFAEEPEEPEESRYNLAVNVDGEGSVSIDPEQDEYESGTTVELTATPADGWEFVEWAGDVNSSRASVEITMDTDKEVTAVFAEEPEENTFNLEVSLDGEGSVSIDPEQSEYESGTMVELTATPSGGWKFVEWTGDINSSRTSVETTMDTDKEVTAVFAEEPEEPEESRFSLAVNVDGDGSVSIDPEQEEYEDGSTVELTATPSGGWEFVEWSGDVNSSEPSVEITMDANKEVTAVFEETFFDLTINTTGDGTVNISPDLNEYEPGTVVELTANPSDGWELDQWEGDLTGTENPASITMENSTEITALFIEQETAFSGGDGSVGNPYQVSTAEQLQTISEFLSSHFIQVNNINAGSTSGWNGGSGFSPIGSSSNPFTGTFNGNGFEISGLTIDRDGDDHVGLFGVAGNAQISNTGLVGVNITGEDIVGGLAGANNGQISNSYVTGNVSGDEIIGGLVGINNGQISGSHSEVDVFGDDDHVGGLAGINGNNGEITDSFASGNVEGVDDEIGGLVGTNNGQITSSYATGNVVGDESVGGLVGTNSGEISRSYATGNVSGDESIGGFVGANRNNARIENSYATGSVSGDDELGGFAGKNWPNGLIATSYASGSVSGDDDTGGFIGWNRASLDSCYWDSQVANQSSGIGRGNQNGLTGLTTSEMTGSSAEENMPGFDWNSVWRTSGSYPVLQ